MACIAGKVKVDESGAGNLDFINRPYCSYLLDDQICQFTRWLPSLLCQHHRNIAGKITLAAILARGHLDIRIEVDRQLLSLLKARK